MNGSQTNPTEREQILAAMQTPPPDGYFVWDGQDEDDRPLSREEMIAGMMQKSETDKSQVVLQLDNDVLVYFHSTGKNWQNHLNNALKEWMQEHHVAA
jgi:uncharacterized protein (DUF4415 family)